MAADGGRAELPTLCRLTFQSCIKELVDDEYLEEAPPLASAVGDWLLPAGRVLTLAMGDADVDRELSAEVGGAPDGAAWLTVLVNGQPRQRVCAEGGGIPDIWLRITRRGREWLASAPLAAEATRRRGRPIDTNRKQDWDLAVAWKSGRYETYAVLASAKGLTTKQVRRAIDRERKRVGKSQS